MLSTIFTALTVLWSILHPFHVSVCEVVYSETSQSLQVSQRIFIDDFEAALNRKYNVNLLFDDDKKQPERDSLIERYLNEKLLITVNGKATKHRYLGSEFEEDGIWCYIEYPEIKKVNSIEVTSTVLIEQFDDQANIIYFEVMGEEKNIKLDGVRSSYTFNAADK